MTGEEKKLDPFVYQFLMNFVLFSLLLMPSLVHYSSSLDWWLQIPLYTGSLYLVAALAAI